MDTILRFPAIANSLSVTIVAAPVKLSLALRKIPVTTTSSIAFTSSSITTFISFLPVYLTSCPFIPTKEKTSTGISTSGRVSEYFPSISVTTPKVVPFKRMVTPGKGIPSLSTTFPRTVIFFISGNSFSFCFITIMLSCTT